MKKMLAIAAAVVFVTAGCAGGGKPVSILVDFSHDEFASFFLLNFPKKVAVHPGTELIFRQTWTGEPHTVTGGTIVSESLGSSASWNDFFVAFETLAASGAGLPNPEDPGDATFSDFAEAVKGAKDTENRDRLIAAWDALRSDGIPLPDLDEPNEMSFTELVELVDKESSGGLPWALDQTEEGQGFITQNAGQPCYLPKGLPPEDPEKPCSEDRQRQPIFDGSHSYYNSGIIPFEGQQGNTYRVQLSDGIKPGTYRFYCAVHGPGQMTEVQVKPQDEEVPSADEINRQARREIDDVAKPVEKQFRDATSKGAIELEGEEIEGPFAGLPGADHVGIDEFIPRRMTVGAGEPITWKMMGADHTISFGVPKYFPVMEFRKNGTVVLNPKIQPAAGGAKEAPEQEGMGAFEVDGGTYDGTGFWSSGLVGAQPYLEYTMRITKPGTYRYACLIHPPMVGTIEVT